MDPNREILGNPCATAGASLGGATGFNFGYTSASFFRFARCELPKLMPRSIPNALIYAVPVPVLHLLDLQPLKGNYLKLIHQATAQLVGKVTALVGNALMDAGHYLATFHAFGSALLGSAELPLRFGQRLLLLAEEPWIGNLFSCRESGKMLQAHVNTDYLSHRGESFRFNFNREESIPLSSSHAPDSERFDRPLNRAVEPDLDVSDLGEIQFTILSKFESQLRVGEAIVAVLPFEPGITSLPILGLEPAEESLEGQVHTGANLLENLGMDVVEIGAFLFKLGQHPDGVISGEGFLPFRPSIPPPRQHFIVNRATGVQGALQPGTLALRGRQPILERFLHGFIIPHLCNFVKGIRAAVSPWMNPGVLAAQRSYDNPDPLRVPGGDQARRERLPDRQSGVRVTSALSLGDKVPGART